LQQSSVFCKKEYQSPNIKATEVTTGWKPVGSSAIVGYGLKSFAHEGLV